MASTFDRAYMALRAGINTAIATYREQNTVPREEWGWDTYAGRMARYALYTAYKDNTVYRSIETFSARLKADNRLYRHIRGVYNPVARQNRLIASNVYQGNVDTERLKTGALPLMLGNEALLEPLIQMARWSNLNQQLSLYVSTAALLGDVGLWLADDPVRQRVRMEVLHPSKIYDVRLDSAGNVKQAVIQYAKAEEPDLVAMNARRHPLERDPDTYVYRMEVDQEAFKTFKDGEPFDYINGVAGGEYAEYPNEYGFVPLALAHYDTTGLKWGINSFYNSLPKINEVNDQASIVNDGIRRVVAKPILKATGMSKTDDKIQTSGSDPQRDDLSILYLPKPDADLEQIEMNLDIMAALTGLDKMLHELTLDMPELALQEMRNQVSAPTAPGVRTLYSDARGAIENARKNLDPPLMSAWLMGVSMAAVGGYEGFGAFSRESFDAGMMDAQIKDRPVIDETLSKTDRLTALSTVSNQPVAVQKLILKELDYSDDEIVEVTTATAAQQEQQTRNAVRGVMDSVLAARSGNGAPVESSAVA